MAKTIYISGKMSESFSADLAKFAAVENAWRDKGFVVVNPANRRLYPPLKLSHRLDAIDVCDAIYMMPCSRECPVANQELEYAMKKGLDMYAEIQ